MNQRYQIITIDAYEFLQKKNNQSYDIDLSKDINPDYFIVKSQILKNDNPLFFQMRELKAIKDEKGEPSEIFKKHIIIFDFHDLFHTAGFKTDKIKDAISSSPIYDQNAKFLAHVFNEGIRIRFNGEEDFRDFIPFEKSQSMAKDCKITFINKDIFDELNKRLSLDIDFKKIKVAHSKYWAYRGLYLTDSDRVKLPLDSEKVIVIDYEHSHPYELKDESGEKQYFNIYKGKKTEGKETDNTEAHTFEIKQTRLEVDCFDGEGLISSAYSKKLQAQMKSSATSWQIRMPFCKGMLHSVDIKEFLKEYAESSDPVIKDIYGIERHLNKAEIILTKGMFKAWAWIKTHFDQDTKLQENYNNDPMQFYFAMIKKYHHGLYIAKDNEEIDISEIDRLNYQFLNPLALSNKDFDTLCDQHFEYGKTEITKKYTKEAKDITGYDNRPAYIKAALRNPTFYSEKVVTESVKNDLRSLKIDLGMGRLHSPGELRFFSGDLLSLMVSLLFHLNDDDEKKTAKRKANIEKLKAKCIKSYCFYMPEAEGGIKLNPDYNYVILRNPSLSRNEELMLKPAYPNEVYKKYFSHLTGLLMISRHSLSALVLSGADFDGDIVRIFTDNKIAKAVEKGCGYKFKKDSDGKSHLKRKLPIVSIPAYTANKSYATDRISLSTILDTFSSNTGKLSNMAVKFSQLEYAPGNEENVLKNKTPNYCPRCTLLTGVDIDSCKTGVKVDADIKIVRKEAMGSRYPNKTTQFLDFKNTVETLYNPKNSFTVKPNPNGYGYIFNTNAHDPIEITKPQDGSINLLYLPYKFAESVTESEYSEDIQEVLPECPPKSNKFLFENDDTWIDSIEKNKDKIKRLEALFNAYKNTNRDMHNFSYVMKKLAETNMYRKMTDLILMKYDDFDSVLAESGETVIDALIKAIELVQSNLKTTEDLYNALKTIKDSSWQFTEKKDRLKFINQSLKFETVPLKESDSMYKLLCDFKFQGYKFLFYVVKHCYYLKAKEQLPKDRKASDIFSKAEGENAYNYYRDLFEVLNNGQKYKSSNSGILDAINTKASFILREEIAENDELLALQYAYYAELKFDKKGAFLWNLIPDDIILDNVNEVKHA